MARRRFQRGTVMLRGKHCKVWVGRWREDGLRPDGTIHRKRRAEVLGTLDEYPTKRLALRALEAKLVEINDTSYRPRMAMTFKAFAEMWQQDVLSTHKPSTESSIKSQLRTGLVPAFGSIALRDVTGERVQRFVSSFRGSPKTVRNHVATLRMMWSSAKAWGYVKHNPFDCLAFPRLAPSERPHFSPEQMQKIICASDEPWKSIFWVAAETGMRASELLALEWAAVNPDSRVAWARKNAWRDGTLHTTKSSKPRAFVISGVLASYLRLHRRDGQSLVWQTSGGKSYDQGNLRRALYEVLDRLRIPQAGMHAFRHGNETIMDRLNTPPNLRQQRLGHSDERMMMRYSHVVSEDEITLAEKLGSMLSPELDSKLDPQSVN